MKITEALIFGKKFNLFLKNALLPIFLLVIFALIIRLILYTGIVRNDDLDYIHLAQDIVLGRYGVEDVVSQPLEEAGWRFGFYLPLALIYHILGPSETTTILFPLASSLLSVIFVYLIGNLLAGRDVGYVAGFLWAMFPLDIHLATDFIPDGSMAAFSTIGVFFFLLGENSVGKKAMWAYGICSIALIWAFFIKPYAIVTITFILFYLAVKLFTDFMHSNWLSELEGRKRLLVTYFPFLAMGTLSLIYITAQPSHLHLLFLRSSQDLLEFFFGVRPNRFNPLITIESTVVALTPLFFVSVSHAVMRRPRPIFLLLWAGFSFAFVEWAPSRPGLIYSPIVPLTESRNFLSIFPPLMILIGILFMDAFRTKVSVKWSTALAGVIVVFAAYAKWDNFGINSMNIISTALIITSLGSFAILGVAKLKSKRRGQLSWLFASFLALALLYPTPAAHFTERIFVNQKIFQQNLQPISGYLLEHQEFPILTFSDDTALNLNYVSDLKFGFNQGATYEKDVYRIELDQNATNREGSFYVVFYTDYRGNVPGNWWRIISSGVNMTQPVVLYRALSQEDAATALFASLCEIKVQSSPANYFELFGAAQNSGNLQIALQSWIELHGTDYQVSLDELSLVANYAVSQNLVSLSQNLFENSDFSDGLDSWKISDGVTPFVQGYVNGIALTYSSDLDNFAGISQFVTLESNTLYFFSLEVKSNIPTRIGQINQLMIDPFEGADIYDEWEIVQFIFVTPDWPTGTHTAQIELVSGRDVGKIEIRSPGLFEPNFNNAD